MAWCWDGRSGLRSRAAAWTSTSGLRAARSSATVASRWSRLAHWRAGERVPACGAAALASGSVVRSGGEIYLVSGGTLSGTTLSGGYDVVLGTAVGTQIK